MKKIRYIITVLLVLILMILFNNYKTPNYLKSTQLTTNEQTTYTKLLKDYKNKNIVAFLYIPNINNKPLPVVQGTDNKYYLNHDINNNSDYKGSIFLDYRNDLNNSNKLIIYGHSDPKGELPFSNLNNYKKYDYYKDNSVIYLYTKTKTYEMQIFSSYQELSDFDYLNLKSFNGLTYKEHLTKLKNKSEYETNIEIDENKKVLILQTCNIKDNNYRLVMAIEK